MGTICQRELAQALQGVPAHHGGDEAVLQWLVDLVQLQLLKIQSKEYGILNDWNMGGGCQNECCTLQFREWYSISGPCLRSAGLLQLVPITWLWCVVAAADVEMSDQLAAITNPHQAWS